MRLSSATACLSSVVVLTIGAALFAPGFRSPNNLQNVLTNAAPLGVVVLGQCLVILVRGFDLSVASVMATAAVIATSFDETTNWSVFPILAVSLLMAVDRRLGERLSGHAAQGFAVSRHTWR